MSQRVSLRAEPATEISRFWPAIVVCFATAVLGWGFGFTGTSVYLAELQRLHHWPSATVASAITACYLLGALCLLHVHAMMRRFGAACRLSISPGLLALGSTVFSCSTRVWELYVAAALMAAGWGLHVRGDLRRARLVFQASAWPGDHSRPQWRQHRRLHRRAAAR